MDGLTGGNVSVANAYLADISTETDRSANFAKMAISSSLGFIVGPALAGVLGATALEELLPVLAAVAISGIGSLLVASLREPDPCAADPGPGKTTAGRVLGLEPLDCIKAKEAARIRWADALSIDNVRYLLLLYLLIFLGFNLFYTAFPVHAALTLEWSIPQTGAFFGLLSLVMVVVQGPILTALSKRIPGPTLIVAGNLLLGSSFLFIMSGHTTTIYLGAALFALGNGVMWPSVLALLSKVAGEKAQGTVQGLAGAVGSLAAIVGLIAGGLLYRSVGSLTFLFCAATIFAVAALSVRLARVDARATS